MLCQTTKNQGMSSPIFLSSGDVIADRRFEWARDREAKGDLAGAADLLMQALELAPGYASAWFMLGGLREKLGDRAGAVAAFGQARAADPQDRPRCRASSHAPRRAPAGAMPEGYVRALFDGYAPRFDQALTEGLSYRAPELLFRAVEAAHAGRRMKFGSVLDLGCGTGLAALPFRPFSDWMVGVDLSSGNAGAGARQKASTTGSSKARCCAFLAGEAAIGGALPSCARRPTYSCISTILRRCSALWRRCWHRPALLAFSVETHEGDGVILRDTLRYAHSEAHVQAALAAAGP